MSGHRIEDTAQVYLVFDGQAWQVDGTTTDGEPLFGLDDGPSAQECMREHTTDAERAACEAELERARETDLPNAEELFRLLAMAISGAVELDEVPS